jgi:mono/diheme cytochrome c family protein
VTFASRGVAQDLGDAEKGHEFVRVACYQCHALEKGQHHSPNPKAPSFSRVAADPKTTAMALRVWLETSHPTMPNLILSEYDKANVIAYILSLKS